MNDDQFTPDFKRLEPLLESAIEATVALPIPADAVERVQAKAKKLSAGDVSPPQPSGLFHRRSRAVRSIVAGLCAAAAILLVAVGSVALLNHSASRAFAEMVEKVRSIASVRFAMSTQFGWGPEAKGAMYLQGNRLRQELFDGALVAVFDFDRKQALLVDTRGKVAQSAALDDKLARAFANPIDQLLHAASGEAERIGEEVLKGRRTRVYRLRKVDLLAIRGDAEMLVWVDIERGLPAKIVIRDTDPKAKTEFCFDNFVWDEPMDPKLFALAVPDGFHAGQVALTPHRSEPVHSYGPANGASAAIVDGTLITDRVPAKIVWTEQGATITALMQDPESVSPLDWRPHELRQWNVATGKLRWSEPILGASWLAGTKDGKTLAVVIGYEVQVRDAATGRIIRKWATEKPLSPLTFSPDGKMLAAGITEWGHFGGKGGNTSGGVEFWDVERGALVRSISDDKPVTFVRYSGDGKFLATSSNDGPVKLWDAASGGLTCIIPGFGEAAFSPDGKTVACPVIASSGDKNIGTVGLFACGDGSLMKSLAGAKGSSASTLLWVEFSPNGRLLAAADWNGTVTLWDVATGERKQTFGEHKGGVHTAVFAPNGAMLATGGEDKSLRLHKVPADGSQPALEK